MKAGKLMGLELKYCERCGGLWLREKGFVDVYCSRCAPEMADLPPATIRRSAVRLPMRDYSEYLEFDEGRLGTVGHA